MLRIKYWPGAVRGWLWAWIAPRRAALYSSRQSQLLRQQNTDLVREIQTARSVIAGLQDQLRERTAERDSSRAELATGQTTIDGLAKTVAYYEARFEAMTRTEALKGRMPTSDDSLLSR